MRKLVLAMVLVMFSVSAWADFAAGYAAYQRGDYATAIAEWRPLAEQGNAEAQLKLGMMYANGQGVRKNYTQAYSWYSLAAKGRVKLRDRLAKKMTPSQIAEGQRLARNWESGEQKTITRPVGQTKTMSPQPSFYGIPGPTRTRIGSIYDYTATPGQVVRATASGTWAYNTFISAIRLFKRQFGGNPDKLMTFQDATKRATDAGVKLDIPQAGIPQFRLDSLVSAKKDELARRRVLNNSPGGFGLGAARFATALITLALDPINIIIGLLLIGRIIRSTALITVLFLINIISLSRVIASYSQI